MVNQRAMKLGEGTVYKVKFYAFLPENLQVDLTNQLYRIYMNSSVLDI